MGWLEHLHTLNASYKFPHCHSGNQKGCHLCPGIGVVKWPLMRTNGSIPSRSLYQGSPRSSGYSVMSWWPPGGSLVPCVGRCGLGKQEGEVSDIVLGIGTGVVGNDVRSRGSSFTNVVANCPASLLDFSMLAHCSMVISLYFWPAIPVPLLPLLYGTGLIVPMVPPHTVR